MISTAGPWLVYRAGEEDVQPRGSMASTRASKATCAGLKEESAIKEKIKAKRKTNKGKFCDSGSFLSNVVDYCLS